MYCACTTSTFTFIIYYFTFYILHFTFYILHFKKVSTTFTADLNIPIFYKKKLLLT